MVKNNMNKMIPFAVLAFAALIGCSGETGPEQGHGDERGASHEEAVKGPQGGRLLADGDFAIEVTIFEAGIPPEFRLYAYDDGDALPPGKIQASIELTRLGNKVERHAFKPEQGYLRGLAEVYEPHSFLVKVTASHEGRTHEWAYESLEGRTGIAEEAAKAAGIETEAAGPATIRQALSLHGTVVPDPQRVYRLRPRFAGVVKEVRKRVGEPVRKGEVLAVVEANESLERFNVVSPGAGVVVSRDANPGMSVADEPILTVADLSTVWVELAAFQHDLGRIKSGQGVVIRDVDAHQESVGRVDTIAAVGSAASQSMTVRVLLPNPKGLWRPGLFVTGEVTVAETPVAVAVKRTALQPFRDWTVVFEQIGDEYEIRPVELGRQDGQSAEVLSGLSAGAVYVTANSYLIKADIEKSGASHDH
jgi:cobalt-zinc-cadmium efflux system membrane fusion protein